MSTIVIDHPVAPSADTFATAPAGVVSRLEADFANECRTLNSDDVAQFATTAFEQGGSAVLVSIFVDPNAPRVARARAFGMLARRVASAVYPTTSRK